MFCIHSLVCSYVYVSLLSVFTFFFFFNDTATTEIYTLSLHDALPISRRRRQSRAHRRRRRRALRRLRRLSRDRKSTRLNSSHLGISYAVFCLKKKNKKTQARNKYIAINKPIVINRLQHALHRRV